MSKKKKTDDIYDLIAGALPENDEEVIQSNDENKEEPAKYNELHYCYAVVPRKDGEKYYDIYELAFDPSTGFSRINGVVDGSQMLPLAIVKAEQKLRALLVLGRRIE